MCCFFFFKQKTAYEMRISDWSSDVCSSDLATMRRVARGLKRYVIDAAEPFIVPATHHGSDRMRGLSEPMPTVTAAHRGEQMLVSPILAGVGGRAGDSEPRAGNQPMYTITAKADTAIIAAHLQQITQGGREHDANGPLKTITTAKGGEQTLVAA